MEKKKGKFKELIRLREVFKKEPRILNFKRPKWFFLRKIYKKKYWRRSFYRSFFKKSFFFKRQHIIACPCDKIYLSRRYQRFLMSKVRFRLFYGTRFKVKQLKRYFASAKNALDFLIKVEYRIDVLLWRLGFFNSLTVTQTIISHFGVFLNGVKINIPSVRLKKGDFIQIPWSVTPKPFGGMGNPLPIKKTPHLPPFYAEVNYNTCEVLILCSPSMDLVPRMYYLYSTYLDILALKNYLRLL